MPSEPRLHVPTLTKAALVDQLRDNTGLPRVDASTLVEGLLDLMKETFEAGESLKISGFGNFVVRGKRARLGRNPHTGAPLTLASRRVLTFKASRVLRGALGESEG